MTVESASSTASLDDLLAKLSEPSTVASLNAILDHADLLAMTVHAMDGFFVRGDIIADSLAAGLGELRVAGENIEGIRDVDSTDVLRSILAFATALPSIAPMFTHLSDSGVVDTVIASEIATPQMVEQISKVGRGLSRAAEADPSSRVDVGGPMALYRSLKDPDISRGLSFFLTALKSIGAEIRAGDGR